jgi:hypothetical protein
MTDATKPIDVSDVYDTARLLRARAGVLMNALKGAEIDEDDKTVLLEIASGVERDAGAVFNQIWGILCASTVAPAKPCAESPPLPSRSGA